MLRITLQSKLKDIINVIMAQIKIRQSQALSTYGPGSIADFPGLSLMILSPDAQRTDNEPYGTSWGIKNGFDGLRKVYDQRLSSLFNVEFFSEPPFAVDTPINREAFPSVSAIRFPGVQFCPKCKTVYFVSQLELLDAQNNITKNNLPFECPRQGCRNYSLKPKLVPMRFVIATSYGHIDDFPWDWFCHKNIMFRGNRAEGPHSCAEQGRYQHLRLEMGDTASISEMRIHCNICGASESLGSIFNQEITFMNPDDPYLCDADQINNLPEKRRYVLARPWYGKRGNPHEPLEYDKDPNPYYQPRVSLSRQRIANPNLRQELKKYFPVTLLRGAANIYFAVNHRGISLPTAYVINNPNHRDAKELQAKKLIHVITGSPAFNCNIECLSEVEVIKEVISFIQNNQDFQKFYGPILCGNYLDILNHYMNHINQTDIVDVKLKTRYEEYRCFLEYFPQSNPDNQQDWYRSELVESNEYDLSLPFINKVVLLHKLKQLNIQLGFTRVRPLAIDELKFTAAPESTFAEERRRMQDVRRYPLITNWLPATVVKGEGIFIEFSNEILNDWLTKESDFISPRINMLNNNYRNSLISFGAINDQAEVPRVNERYVLLHTLSHLLIDTLSNDSGYGSSSLSEIIYCDNGYNGVTMNGILIYTSTSDAEGTLGGLVNLGKPGKLEEIFRLALEKALWCSSDPICIESNIGQGFMGLNLAACHACSMLPETCCENMNKFLDRALLVGNLSNSDSGFFKFINFFDQH